MRTSEGAALTAELLARMDADRRVRRAASRDTGPDGINRDPTIGPAHGRDRPRQHGVDAPRAGSVGLARKTSGGRARSGRRVAALPACRLRSRVPAARPAVAPGRGRSRRRTGASPRPPDRSRRDCPSATGPSSTLVDAGEPSAASGSRRYRLAEPRGPQLSRSHGRARHTGGMATEPSHPPLPPLSLRELTVREASGDLLNVDPLGMGPGSAALAAERGPAPADGRERGRR